MLFVFSCLLILLTVLLLHWTNRRNEFDKIPGPSGSFLLHNTLDFLMDPVKMFHYFKGLCRTYKRLFRLKFAHIKVVIMYHPEDVETVISGTKNITKGYFYSFIEPWLQEGLLTSKGSKWHKRRKLLTPAFHFRILNNFKTVIEDSCQKLVEKLRVEVNETKTDLAPYVNDFALNSICETAMGTELDEENNHFGKAYKEGIYKLGQYAVYRAQRFWMYPDFLFKFTSLFRKQDKVLNILTSFRDRVIENRRKSNLNIMSLTNDDVEYDYSMDVSNKKKMALLDLLLEAEKQGTIDAKGIGEEVDTFMFGGHDTSANALQFTMMLLANHQDAQENVVNECKEIFGTSDRPATVADLAQMKYLEACIKESLRLYPPLPVITRKVEQTIKLDEYEIPAGTECVILIFCMHRLKDQFVNPHEFHPERFLTEPTWQPFAFIPFSAGPRNCIGQKFAMMELKLVLSAILRRYHLVAVTKPKEIVFVTDYVLRVKKPIYVKFEERK